MKIRDMPTKDFYILARKAMLETLEMKRATARAIKESGYSIDDLIHDLWILLANTNTGKYRPSTYILRAAKRMFSHKRRRRKQNEQLDSKLTYSTKETLLDCQLLPDSISQMLKTMPQKERTAIRMRLGLDGETQSTLKEVAKHLKTYPDTIRRVEASAIKRIQTTYRSKMLASFVDNQ